MHLRKDLGKGFEKEAVGKVFRAFLLWMIFQGETHGYDLIKRINADPGMPRLTASRIYPILKELTQEKMISQKKQKDGKRVRKVYRITPKGLDILKCVKKHLNSSPLRRQYLLDLLDAK